MVEAQAKVHDDVVSLECLLDDGGQGGQVGRHGDHLLDRGFQALLVTVDVVRLRAVGQVHEAHAKGRGVGGHGGRLAQPGDAAAGLISGIAKAVRSEDGRDQLLKGLQPSSAVTASKSFLLVPPGREWRGEMCGSKEHSSGGGRVNTSSQKVSQALFKPWTYLLDVLAVQMWQWWQPEALGKVDEW